MRTIRYTDALDTSSTAVRTLYFDKDTSSVWLVFPNETVVSRYRLGLSLTELDRMLSDNDGSLGKLWNNEIKSWSVYDFNTFAYDVKFVKRAEVTVTVDPTDAVSVPNADAGKAIAGSRSMTVTINVRGLGLLDLHAVADALDLAGIDADILGAESW